MDGENGRVSVVLGLNAYHGDSSACLVVDGEVVAAAEEERFNRIKHWSGFPSEAIRWVLDDVGVAPGDIDHVAVNRDPRVNVGRKIAYTLRHRVSPRIVVDRLRNARAWQSLDEEVRALFPGEDVRWEFHHVEHHLAHLASGFLPSGLDEAAVVSIDGFGDFASTAWGRGRGHAVSLDGHVYFPHSLGVFYQAITQYLGFPNYGEEYKVMGLAPYGEPTYADELRRVVRLASDGRFSLDLSYFRVLDPGSAYGWRNCAPEVGQLYSPRLEQLLGPARSPDEELEQRHKDVARSVQVVFEDAFFNLLNVLHRRYGTSAVVVSGGCAANSVANGKIFERTPFTAAYIPPAGGDAGGAIGAAMLVAARHGDAPKPLSSAYLGPAFGETELAALLERSHVAGDGVRMERIDDEARLCSQTADAIAEGKVVGWFQGRMEWGPRALGNRSILCDPRRPDMKAILNDKIKRRESFRPFAPSVLREKTSEWFELDDDVPYMSKVFFIRPELRERIPAVTHVDGTGRLQTVRFEENERYHALISAFDRLTGVPMVLNTSFNENEPIVCRPEEALDCFLRTNMDVLVIGQYFLSR